MYSEARAKRILFLEKEAAMLQWDKENKVPRKPTLRQQVEAALSDGCWLKSAPALAGKDSYRSEWHNLERSAKVAVLHNPSQAWQKRREAFESHIDTQHRQRLIDMLKEK